MFKNKGGYVLYANSAICCDLAVPLSEKNKHICRKVPCPWTPPIAARGRAAPLNVTALRLFASRAQCYARGGIGKKLGPDDHIGTHRRRKLHNIDQLFLVSLICDIFMR